MNICLPTPIRKVETSLYLGCLEAACEPYMRKNIRLETHFRDVLARLDSECTKTGLDIAISKYGLLYKYRYDQSLDFASFLQEFNKRFTDFSRLRGCFELGEAQRILTFIRAIDYSSSPFRHGITTTSQISRIAGYGEGESLSFDSITTQVENAMNSFMRQESGQMQDNHSFLSAHGHSTSTHGRV